LLWHAVRAICVRPVEHVFVVLAPEYRAFSRHDCSGFAGKLEPLCCGGGTRRDSVYNGLVAAMAAVDADDWMLVHDAARACLPKKDQESLIRETEAAEVGGILALPVADTVKAVAKDEAGVQRIDRTEHRAQLLLAPAPQTVRARLLAPAPRRANDPGP